MAWFDSGPIPISQDTYNLGEYEFYILVSEDPINGKTYVNAQCRKGDAVGIRGIEIDGVVYVSSWSVEANEDTASVYVTIIKGDGSTSDLDTGNVEQPIFPQSELSVSYGKYKDIEPWYTIRLSADNIIGFSNNVGANNRRFNYVFASQNPNPIITETRTDHYTGDVITESHAGTFSFTYQGKTVYFGTMGSSSSSGPVISVGGFMTPYKSISEHDEETAWTMIYGSPAGKLDTEEVLVARFAIDLRDADGGPDGPWDEPGDDGDPTKTLEVVIFGSDAGRHVDPLHRWDSTHYQYWPADQEQAWNYGCGGDGGHGGGGGGGSAAVFVKEFATNKADGKIIELHCGRHGYGSGGGKGGQGGDGCIIVYW